MILQLIQIICLDLIVLVIFLLISFLTIFDEILNFAFAFDNSQISIRAQTNSVFFFLIPTKEAKLVVNHTRKRKNLSSHLNNLKNFLQGTFPGNEKIGKENQTYQSFARNGFDIQIENFCLMVNFGKLSVEKCFIFEKMCFILFVHHVLIFVSNCFF